MCPGVFLTKVWERCGEEEGCSLLWLLLPVATFPVLSFMPLNLATWIGNFKCANLWIGSSLFCQIVVYNFTPWHEKPCIHSFSLHSLNFWWNLPWVEFWSLSRSQALQRGWVWLWVWLLAASTPRDLARWCWAGKGSQGVRHLEVIYVKVSICLTKGQLSLKTMGFLDYKCIKLKPSLHQVTKGTIFY